MRKIPLTKGATALVDDEDYEYLMQWRWHLHSAGYASRKPRGDKQYYMHRELIACPLGMEVDHINRNPLDNRKQNLRAVPHWENMQNRPKQKNNKTGFKGVYYDRRRKLWWAMKVINRRKYYLGNFHAPAEAAMVFAKFQP